MGEDYKKHSGVISRFSEMYLKTNILPQELSKTILMAFVVRNRSDYEDFFICSVADTEKLTSEAEVFLKTVSNFLMKKYGE